MVGEDSCALTLTVQHVCPVGAATNGVVWFLLQGRILQRDQVSTGKAIKTVLVTDWSIVARLNTSDYHGCGICAGKYLHLQMARPLRL